eukprot:6569405-Pyramimonas_sp.AAC.1
MVAKKRGAQRIIFDARWVNLDFPPPPRAQLPTAAAFGRLETAECDICYFYAGDIQNAFSAIAMPEALGDAFRLAPVRAEAVGCPPSTAAPLDEVIGSRRASPPPRWAGAGLCASSSSWSRGAPGAEAY